MFIAAHVEGRLDWFSPMKLRPPICIPTESPAAVSPIGETPRAIVPVIKPRNTNVREGLMERLQKLSLTDAMLMRDVLDAVIAQKRAEQPEMVSA